MFALNSVAAHCRLHFQRHEFSVYESWNDVFEPGGKAIQLLENVSLNEQ